jgi:hypothetical protein
MTLKNTLKQRQKTHGNFQTHAKISQQLKAVLWEHGHQSLDHDQVEALEMICHKIARILNGNPNTYDHWHDIAGYSTLVADRLGE